MVDVRLIALACMAMIFIQCVNGAVKVRSLPKQCIDSGFAGACASSTEQTKVPCSATLACAVSVDGKNYKQSNGRVPENTPCGNLKVCKNSKCVAVTENPTVVGSTSGLKCGAMVATANKITPREPEPLSP